VSVLFLTLFPAKSSWTTDGISLAQSLPQQSVSDFHQYFEVVFIDVTGSYNFCADMGKEVFLWVCTTVLVFTCVKQLSSVIQEFRRFWLPPPAGLIKNMAGFSELLIVFIFLVTAPWHESNVMNSGYLENLSCQ
jgi:hypothetical protein